MSDDTVNIEVDGKAVVARKGQMIIEVTDSVKAYVPRFCYHDKLSIAANCRMCLVEVEKAPKPIPACATPVGEGMKIFTKSPKAISAQKATMEFLLINHPLDCPICDQGGECELQDLAMGYGRDISRYNDGKRVVADKDIGPLISTDMTRCIHCTRCVRFGEEIQGNPQLGTVERGENVKISTYVEQNVDHELSANIIDLCPVGALNNKPYRYSARAWEMVQRATVSPHDCVGTNLYAHVLRGTVKRIVPRENEAINEAWISDRDRFSYEAIYSDERLKTPQVKENGEWREASWDEALERAADGLKGTSGNKLGLIASPSSTMEECHLLAKLAAHLGTVNIDHRIHRSDVTDQKYDASYDGLPCALGDLEKQDAILVVGSNIRSEAPIIAHRLRKAALAGAQLSVANTLEYEYHFDIADYLSGEGLVTLLTGVAVAAASDNALPDALAAVCEGVEPSDEQARIAESLHTAGDALVLLGNIGRRHPAYSVVRALAVAISDMTAAQFGMVTEGSNSAGAALAGVLPHRSSGGNARSVDGQSVGQMLSGDVESVLLLNVEPDADIHAVSDATEKLAGKKLVVAMSAFDSAALRTAADVLLPIGTFAETSGTYVNVTGDWQSFTGVANPVGESRPAWKVLRVLGNLTGGKDFNYVTSDDVLAELRAEVGDVSRTQTKLGSGYDVVNGADLPQQEVDVPLYGSDPMVRRADALQRTINAKRSRGESAST